METPNRQWSSEELDDYALLERERALLLGALHAACPWLNHADAEDIVQEAFLELWTRFRREAPPAVIGETTEQQREKLHAWLFTVGRRAAAKRFRDKQPKVSFSGSGLELISAVDPARAAMREEFFFQLRASLPKTKWTAFMMLLEGSTRKQVADRLGKDVRTIRRWIADCRRIAKKVL